MELAPHQYTAYGLNIASHFALPPLKETQFALPDLLVQRGALPPPPSWEATKVYRAGLNARFAKDGPHRLWLDWSPFATFVAKQGTRLTVATTQSDEGLVSLFTLSEAIGLILFQRGYFLLHGSGLAFNGSGVVFLGQPGAGKSTTAAAFAQRGARLLSDDMVCIRITETGEPWLVPAFSQLKLWGKSVEGLRLERNDLHPIREGAPKFSWHESVAFEETAVPLARIYVLTNEPADSSQSLPRSQVPVELLRYFPLPDSLLSGVALKAYFEKSIAIAEATPVFRMQRPVDFTSLYTYIEQLKTTL